MWTAPPTIATAAPTSTTTKESLARSLAAGAVPGVELVAVSAKHHDKAAGFVKTLAHEAGHCLLHNPQDRGEGPVCRDLIEGGAEGVAGVCARPLCVTSCILCR